MSNEMPQGNPSAPSPEVQALVDQQTAAMQADNNEQIAQQEAEVKKAEEAQKPQEDKFAQKFAALSRKEKAIRDKERALEMKIKEMETRSAQLEAEIKSKYVDPEMLTQDPLKVLSEKGLSPEQLAELILNNGKKTPERLLEEYDKKMQAKLSEYEQKLQAKEQAEKQAQLEKVTNEFKNEIASFVSATPDYELIRANSAESLVYDVIEEHYLQTQDENGENGTILSNKEACDLVESYLLEQAKSVWEKANKKLSTVYGLKSEAKPEPKGQSPTLSNAMSASAPKNADRKLTDEESKQLAAKMIRWID